LDAVEFIQAGGDAVFEDEGYDGEAGTDGEAGGEDPAFPGVQAGIGAEGPTSTLSVTEQGDCHEDRVAEEERPFCDPGGFGLKELGHDRVSSSGLVFSKRWKNWGFKLGNLGNDGGGRVGAEGGGVTIAIPVWGVRVVCCLVRLRAGDNESDLQGGEASSTFGDLQMKKALFVVILVLAGVVAWPRLRELQRGEVSGGGGVDMATAVATNRNIRFSVTAAGDISPREQVSVRPEVNGRIAELAVDIGDSVARDALLFSLDDRDLQIEMESQEKETERAKLQLDQAERNYLRAKELYEANLIAEELFEQSKTDYQLARNALERSQKSLDLVNDRIRKTRILAPFACTVLTRPVSVGQAVSGSGGFNSGTEVLTIADLNEMIINAHINQADVTRLSVEQRVDVEVEAVPGLKVVGTVERIAPQATIKNNIKGFATRILLRNVDKRIRPGMTANIRIPVASADNVVSVPLAAVFTDIDQETGARDRYVYVRRGGQFERRPVQVGISDLFYAEIQKGLESGEVVALEVPQDVLEGQSKGQASAS
jgi:HlyD family secretion protein